MTKVAALVQDTAAETKDKCGWCLKKKVSLPEACGECHAAYCSEECRRLDIRHHSKVCSHLQVCQTAAANEKAPEKGQWETSGSGSRSRRKKSGKKAEKADAKKGIEFLDLSDAERQAVLEFLDVKTLGLMERAMVCNSFSLVAWFGSLVGMRSAALSVYPRFTNSEDFKTLRWCMDRRIKLDGFKFKTVKFDGKELRDSYRIFDHILFDQKNSTDLDIALYMVEGGAVGVEFPHYMNSKHTPLQVVSSKGLSDIAQALMAKGADPNEQSFLNKKMTALIAASQEGRVKTVEALLQGGADPNLTDQVGLTALMYASMYGHVEVMQLLIEAGSPVNQKDKQSIRFPLLLAAENNHAGAVRVLLEAGAEVDMPTDGNGNVTPLGTAAHFGRIAAMMALINGGANVDNVYGNGLTALGLATEGGFPAAVQVLIRSGADPDLGRKKPIQSAVSLSNLPILQALIKAGADTKGLFPVSVENGEDELPLLLIAIKSNASSEVVQEVLGSGVDVNATPGKNLHRETALVIACLHGNADQVQMLLQAGAEPDPRADGEHWSALVAAIQEGQHACIKALLEGGANPNTASEGGLTPLLAATQEGSLKIVEALLKAGANSDTPRRDGVTPLLAATAVGSLEIAETLLKAGANPNAVTNDDEVTPLLMATQEGSLKIVEALLKAGANSDTPRRDGVNPLLMAVAKEATKEKHEMTDALLGAGADPNVAIDDRGETPLLVATQKGSLEIVEALLKAGAEIDMAKDDGVTPLVVAAFKGNIQILEALLRAGASLDHSAEVWPLLVASEQGHRKAVRALIEAGADVDKASTDGITALWKAAVEGHIHVVEALLQACCDRDQADERGQTPLLVASGIGRLSIVAKLVMAGADLDLAANNGSTPLVAAAQHGHKAVVDVLIKGWASVNEGHPHTPLVIAAANNHSHIVDSLLAAGADPGRMSGGGDTPLFVAAHKGHQGIARVLLDTGKAGINAVDDSGLTALHAACFTPDNLECVQLLIDSGAALDVGDKGGRTPMHFACERGHLDYVRVLAEAGADIRASGVGNVAPVDLAMRSNQLEVVNFLVEAGATLSHKGIGLQRGDDSNPLMQFVPQYETSDRVELLSDKIPDHEGEDGDEDGDEDGSDDTVAEASQVGDSLDANASFVVSADIDQSDTETSGDSQAEAEAKEQP